AQLAKGLTAGANYTYLDATFQSPEVIDGSGNSSNSSAIDGFPGVEGTINIQPGDRIPLVPRQSLKLYADLDLANAWQVGADLIAQSSATARGNENGLHQPDGVYYLGPGRYPGFGFLNLRAEYRPTKGLRLFGQVGNVFNRQYSTAAQLGATAFNDAGNYVARPFPANANGDFPLRNATFYAPGAPRTFSAGLQYWF
ncbi:MAG TPA: TonB-dependent receptor, partial [Burkholderiaceae bacterium]